MDDANNEQEEDRLDIQAHYSKIIADYKVGLEKWLKNEGPRIGEIEDFEDRELDALLLKVDSMTSCAKTDIDRTISRTT